MFENMNQSIMITVALILILVLTLVGFNLYDKHSIDETGKPRSLTDTIKSILGMLPPPKPVQKPEVKPVVKAPQPSPAPKPTDTPKKEVYNVDNNDFTYDEAPLVCKAFGGELATYDQLNDSFNSGANWCNYGWTANQMALYPIQQKFFDELQKTPDKDTCGKPGINGGYFADTKLKFGVNCYGIKPKPDPAKLVSLKDDDLDENGNPKTPGLPTTEDVMSKLKSRISAGELDVRPYNSNKWSAYSFKKSVYVINPKQPAEPIKVESVISDSAKDPRTINAEQPVL